MRACLEARICAGSGWSRTVVADELDYSFVAERCNSVDGRLGWGQELELGFGSYSCVMGLGHVGLGRSGRRLGILDCSIFRHKNRRRIGLTYRKDRHSCVELHLVDIVVEQLAELAVVVLEGQLVNDLR